MVLRVYSITNLFATNLEKPFVDSQLDDLVAITRDHVSPRTWGNQTGVEHLAEAVYEGSLVDFLRGWFPEPSPGRPATKR